MKNKREKIKTQNCICDKCHIFFDCPLGRLYVFGQSMDTIYTWIFPKSFSLLFECSKDLVFFCEFYRTLTLWTLLLPWLCCVLQSLCKEFFSSLSLFANQKGISNFPWNKLRPNELSKRIRWLLICVFFFAVVFQSCRELKVLEVEFLRF